MFRPLRLCSTSLRFLPALALASCVSEPQDVDAIELDDEVTDEPSLAAEPPVTPPPVERELAELSTAELDQRIEALRGDRSYHDLDADERAHFDALARAREFRLGVHASDHLVAPDGGEPLPAFDPPLPDIEPPVLDDPPVYYRKDVIARPFYRASITLPLTASAKQFSTADLKQILPPLPGFAVPPPISNADTRIVVRRGAQTWTNDNCNGNTKASCVTTSTASGTYVITVFATSTSTWGFTDVYHGATKLVDDAEFGGSLITLNVPTDGVYAMDAVHVARGATDTKMVLFDDTWNELGYDNDAGIGTAARVAASVTEGGHRLLVGAYASSTTGSTRLTNVVFNACLSETHACDVLWSDFLPRGDRDRDSVANGLEDEIGTDPDNPDTDGDGLFDYIEVIGHREGTSEQSMVSIGANPRRRDLFVEIDHSNDNPAFDAAEVVLAQTILSDMPTLVNDDGSTGIRVHVDAGVPCADATMCGDWGGSEQLSGVDNAYYYQDVDAILPHFRASRRGVFLYGHRQIQYSGQSDPDGTGWTLRLPDEELAEVMLHEAGHLFGLSHGGTAKWANGEEREHRNRKLVYPSLMNYNYQLGVGGGLARFSSGELPTIDHRWLDESGYAVGQSKAHFDDGPYSLQLFGADDVDWNRDGRISDEPVIYDDGPLNQHRTGSEPSWPEFVDRRPISSAVPTGGPSMVVEAHDNSGFAATTWVFAPFQHADGIYPDVTAMSDQVGLALPWDDFTGGEPLPGGGLVIGEVSAARFAVDGEDRIVVAFPDQDGVLHTNLYDPDAGFGAWTPIPNWPEDVAVRTATLAVVDGRLTVVARDFLADDDEPNTWLVRMEADGSWQPWQQLEFPSFATPGLAEGPNGNEYLAYVMDGSDPDISSDERPIRFARRAAGSDDPWVMLEYPIQKKSLMADDFPAVRTRVTLLFRPYRYALGAPFEDGSGYLAVFWTAGESDDKDSWHVWRAYTPGRVSPTEEWFPARDSGRRGHGMVDRPKWLNSPAAVERHWDVQVAYDAVDWQSGETLGVYYQPYGGGSPAVNPVPHDDNDDVEVIADSMCSTLRTYDGNECWCVEGPKGSC